MLQHTKAGQIQKFKVGLENIYVALWQLLWRIKWIMPHFLGKVHLSASGWLDDIFTSNMKICQV